MGWRYNFNMRMGTMMDAETRERLTRIETKFDSLIKSLANLPARLDGLPLYRARGREKGNMNILFNIGRLHIFVGTAGNVIMDGQAHGTGTGIMIVWDKPKDKGKE